MSTFKLNVIPKISAMARFAFHFEGQREDQKNVINPSGTQEEIDMF